MTIHNVAILNLLFTMNLYAGDSTIVSFALDNIYAFGGTKHCHGQPGNTPVAYAERIVSDTMINNQRYFVFSRSQKLSWVYFPGDTGVTSYRRADSTSIYQYDISAASEDTIVNFKDTIGTFYSYGRSIIFKGTLPVLGINYSSVMTCCDVTYSSKLFLTHYFLFGICEEDIFLKGAVIDGIYYGDSNLVSVNEQWNGKVNNRDYTLYQNYPNPFNPITQIEFYNPTKGHISLRVYDVLGRQVASLADGPTERGRFMVTFDASRLASGLYFYGLQGGSSLKVKKLILMK